jgi:hypothetical protein
MFERILSRFSARSRKNDSHPLWAYRVVEIFPFDGRRWTVEFSFQGRAWQRLYDSEYYGAGYGLPFAEANDLAAKLATEAGDRERTRTGVEAKQAAAEASAIVYAPGDIGSLKVNVHLGSLW